MTPIEALAGIPGMSESAEVVGTLAGGPTSDSYLVAHRGQRFVLRVDTPISGALRLDRSTEAVILEHMYHAGIGPQLKFVDADRGIFVTHYIDGRPWTEADFADPARIASLAQLLRRVHAVSGVGERFALPEKLAEYAARIGTQEAARLETEAQAHLQRLGGGKLRECLCHNDLVCANLVEGRQLYLIDWEYAAIGDPFFDLATVVQHHGLEDAQADALLSAYFGTVSRDARDRLRLYREVYSRLLSLWDAVIATY